MIILQNTLKEISDDRSKKASSPSSYFKSKWLEERDMRTRYKNLNLDNLSEVVKERMQVSDAQKSEFQCFMIFARGAPVKNSWGPLEGPV